MCAWINKSLSEAVDVLSRHGYLEIAENMLRIQELSDFVGLNGFRVEASEDLSDMIECVSSPKEFCNVLDDVCELYGFDYCSVLVVNENSVRIHPSRLAANWPDELIDMYVKHKLYYLDPAFASASTNSTGCYWHLIDASPYQTDIINTMALFGVGPSGYTFVVEGPDLDLYAVSVSSSASISEFTDKLERARSDLETISRELVTAFLHVSGIAHPKHHLTDEELSYLRSMGIGLTAEEIFPGRDSERLRIEAAICKKMGTRTLVESVVAALAAGCIEEAPLTRCEIWTADHPLTIPSESQWFPRGVGCSSRQDAVHGPRSTP